MHAHEGSAPENTGILEKKFAWRLTEREKRNNTSVITVFLTSVRVCKSAELHSVLPSLARLSSL